MGVEVLCVGAGGGRRANMYVRAVSVFVCHVGERVKRTASRDVSRAPILLLLLSRSPPFPVSLLFMSRRHTPIATLLYVLPLPPLHLALCLHPPLATSLSLVPPL